MIRELIDNPARFDFFAAVRLLEGLARTSTSAGNAVGDDNDPEREVARFRAEPSLSFSVGDIAFVKDSNNGSPTQMSVNFLGLTGPNGTLPQHYTSLLLARLRERDRSLRDFYDLFNHRTISLFYRAWEKYRFAFRYERARRDGDECDFFTECLFCLVGLGTDGQRGRRNFDDRVSAFFGGVFSSKRRPAHELERVLAHQFRLPVAIQQFFGRWLMLDNDQMSRLTGQHSDGAHYNRLGVDAVVGRRIWDVQGSFRVVVGPLSYQRFCELTPSGRDLKPFCELVRSFVGPELEFDVQVLLAPGEVPECRLQSTTIDGPQLGWNTWLRSAPIEREVDDAIFLLQDV